MKEDGVFYDIGANVGYISLEMANLFQHSTVISFEPQPSLAECIAVSCKLNSLKNINVFDVMVGESWGEADLFIGSHSIHASAVAREEKSNRIKRVVVSVDDLMENKVIPPPDLIKLDIEGGELAALLGAGKTIGRYQPTIIFETDDNMTRFHYTRQDILDAILEMGTYEFFFLSVENSELIPLSAENKSLDYSDIVARPIE